MFGSSTSNVMVNPSSFDLDVADGLVHNGSTSPPETSELLPRHHHLPSVEDRSEPHDETEIKLACHTILIGNYAFKPASKVRITSEGVSFPAPRLHTAAPEAVILHLPLKCFVQVLALADPAPVILLYTEAKTGERVRIAIGMRHDSGPFFDPASSSDRIKRIALLPSSLGRRAAGALRTLFGMVLDDLPRLDPRVAAALASAQSILPELKAARAPPVTQELVPCGSSLIKKSASLPDDASSSSSVIFPPSSPPISLSSHSSHSSEHSSHSSRKRKARCKKTKNNKKTKYVLVKKPEPNDVEAFLAGVAPILKGLNPICLNNAKYEIMSSALKYEKQMLLEKRNGDNCE